MASAAARIPLDREFSRLYARDFAFVWRLVRRSGVDPADVDDVVQDVFVVVYRRLEDFEHRSQIKTWLTGIVRRVVWRHRRGRARAHRKHEGLRAAAVAPDGFSAQRGMALDRLDRFVAGLPRGQREVFVLSELEGMRGPEIAQATGTNLNTVYARIRSSRGRFRHWCEGDERPPAQIRRHARASANPPDGTDRRVWGLVVARLGSEAKVIGTGTIASSWVANIKTFAVVVGVGLVGVTVARASVGAPRHAPARTVSADAPMPTPSHRARVPPSSTESAPTAPPPRSEAESTMLARPPKPSPAPSPPSVRSPTPPSSADALANERRLIAAARTLLDTDPQRALARLDEHGQAFPSGLLKPERIRLALRAWCRLQRPDRARAIAAATSDPAALLARECPSALDSARTEIAATGDSSSAEP